MKKLNIAEILKDCPKGTKLYTPLLGECELKEIIQSEIFVEQGQRVVSFNKYGNYWDIEDSECILFPSKDKKDWSIFQRPFKDGDVIKTITGNKYVFYSIYRAVKNKAVLTYIDYIPDENKIIDIGCVLCLNDKIIEQKLATEEEKQKLFDAIKANGYKWNAETKTLEKLIVPKFKVGDTITNGMVSFKISHIDKDYYYSIGKSSSNRLLIKNQDDWRLDKFDITTLKPFDKVLVREHNLDIWVPDFYGIKNTSNCEYEFNCVVSECNQCIPYNDDTKDLLGTNKDCPEYYRTW